MSVIHLSNTIIIRMSHELQELVKVWFTPNHTFFEEKIVVQRVSQYNESCLVESTELLGPKGTVVRNWTMAFACFLKRLLCVPVALVVVVAATDDQKWRSCGDANLTWSALGEADLPRSRNAKGGHTCKEFATTSARTALQVVKGPSCEYLQVLDFTGARLGSSGAGEILSSVLVASPDGKTAFCQARQGFIRKILLGDNELGDDGAAAVAAVLIAATSTRNDLALGLERNSIGDGGAARLASALMGRHKITDLRLDGNPIGAAGAVDIARAIDHGSSLRLFSYFDLTGTAATNSTGAELNKEEIEYYSSLYVRELEAAAPFLTPGCVAGPESSLGCEQWWPSCQLAWATRLAPFSDLLQGCRSVTARMASTGVAARGPDNGAAAFRAFLERDPVAILARAMRRRMNAVRPVARRFGDPINYAKLPRVHTDTGTECVDPNNPRRDASYFASARSVLYVRVPKTASTATMAFIHNNPCLESKVRVLDHGDGCLETRFCNGSCPRAGVQAEVAVLRDPTDHFLSAVSHLARVTQDLMPKPPGSRYDRYTWADVVSVVMSLLRRASRGCSNNHTGRDDAT